MYDSLPRLIARLEKHRQTCEHGDRCGTGNICGAGGALASMVAYMEQQERHSPPIR